MIGNDTRLIERRAEQLAVVYLTRRSDLDVSVLPEHNAVDILVTLRVRGQDTGRRFGVNVTAIGPDSSDPIQAQSSHVRRAGGRQAQTFPVCAMMIDVVRNAGFWRWLQEPILEKGQALLLSHAEDISSPLRDLTASELNMIVDLVNRWYDSRGNWQVAQQRNQWQVVDASGTIIANADDRHEAMLIASAPEVRDVLFDALALLKELDRADPQAERALTWTVKALNDSMGNTDNLIDAAPALVIALRKALKYLSAAATTNETAESLQATARQALRKALG
jgi:hypothetical protein